MKIKPKLFYLLILSLAIAFSSCKSKKNALSSTKNKSEKSSSKIINQYADLMAVSPKSIKNKKLYEFIEDWKGTKYEFGGLNKRGIDCSGLVFLAYRDVYGKQIPRNTSQQLEIIKRKYEGQLKEGDLVFFDYDNKKFSHVGIYLQNGYYFHASSRKGVMVAKLKDPFTYKYFSRGGSIM